MNLLLNVRRDGPETTVLVAGEIDLGSGQRLLEYAREAIRQHGPRLAVDLAGVTFMDCGGVMVLLSIRTRAHRLGGYLSVVAASGAVRRVLDILELDRTLAIPEPSEVDGVVRSFDAGTTSSPFERVHPG
jgi:anti-anti-sigma factor